MKPNMRYSFKNISLILLGLFLLIYTYKKVIKLLTIPESQETHRSKKERQSYCEILKSNKSKNIFVVVLDPLRNDQNELANTISEIYNKASCASILSVAVVTGTPDLTQRVLEKKLSENEKNKAMLENNLLLRYVEVIHPCSVDAGMHKAINTEYNQEEYICVIRAGVQLTENWDMHAVQQLTGQTNEEFDNENKSKTVIISVSRNLKSKSSFPLLVGWNHYDNNICTPCFSWHTFKVPPVTCQVSSFFTTAFCFSAAKLWFDCPPDVFLPPITPLNNDWLYTLRLLNIGWKIKIATFPLACLTNRMCSYQNNEGLDRLSQWYSQPNLLANAAIYNGIDNEIIQGSWAAHAGIININDEEEVAYKYGSLVNAEKLLSIIRNNFNKINNNINKKLDKKRKKAKY